MITHQRLIEILSYDEETGEFRWKVQKGKMPPGSLAGAKVGKYRHISIDGKPYLSHVVAWFYTTGEWPKGVIDHKSYGENPDAKDNLRVATWQQNRYNTAPKQGGHSKWKGVTFDKGRKKCWKMKFKMPDGTSIQSRYEDEREAAEEYMFLALEHHGEFARFE